MKRAPMLRWAVVLALAAGGCGDDGPTSASLTAADLAGTWAGTTSQSLGISFTVTSQGITSASLSYRLSGSRCSYTADVTLGSSQPLAIINGQFDTGDFFLGPNTRLQAAGRFTSRTQGNGSAIIEDGQCGGTTNLTWSASKR